MGCEDLRRDRTVVLRVATIRQPRIDTHSRLDYHRRLIQINRRTPEPINPSGRTGMDATRPRRIRDSARRGWYALWHPSGSPVTWASPRPPPFVQSRRFRPCAAPGDSGNRPDPQVPAQLSQAGRAQVRRPGVPPSWGFPLFIRQRKAVPGGSHRGEARNHVKERRVGRWARSGTISATTLRWSWFASPALRSPPIHSAAVVTAPSPVPC